MARLTNEQADRVFESNLRRQESALERKLNANFNQLSKDIQALMESYDTAGAEAVVSLNDIVLEQILLEAYEVGNSRGARMAASDLEEDESLVEEAALLALLLWRVNTASRVSKEINRTTRKVFDKILGRAVGELTIRDDAGQIIKSPTNKELSIEVAKRTKAENKRRSGTISTTEAQRGTQEGANQAGTTAGTAPSTGTTRTIPPVGTGTGAGGVSIPDLQRPQKVTKTWRSQGDRRVRPTHRRANGQTVNMDETFNVGRGKGRFPTDSMLPREESIGCRCYLRFRKVKI